MAVNHAIIGVDLGGTHVRVGRVRDGKIESSLSRPISGTASTSVVLDEVFSAIDAVLDGGVSGIGFCVPSVVDVDTGVVHSVTNIPSWREVPLKQELERRYGVRSFINNDANAFAVGELHFGKGRGYRNLVGIVVGTGLGAGVVINGRLYSGTNCGAGEIGNIPYRGSTIESWCSGTYLRQAGGMDGETLYDRARAGDPFAQELLVNVGTALGDAILIVLYSYDPEIVILGGSVSRAYPLFEQAMRERLQTYAFPHALRRLQIACTETSDVALLGAAAIYLDGLSRRDE
ncbi:MAG TPA: ROK family protein [Thermoanaerobaculia bacterium]|jgi:glucokinase|nr:ROK family protein [Thermoanaerobaculia bacterium]